MRTCTVCGIAKPLHDYYNRSADGRKHSHCKECHKAKVCAQRYGLTLAQYRDMFVRQGNRCAICGLHNDDNYGRPLSVDHDHLTGRVRGLLCTNCNHLIGHCRESIPILVAAIDYLRKYR